MGYRVLLLGLGFQGRAALHDLVNWSDVGHVTVVDNRADMAQLLASYPGGRVTGRAVDAAHSESLAPLIRSADVVVEALPASFALPMGRLAADCGTSLASSMYYLSPGELDPAEIQSVRRRIGLIDRDARDKGVVILTEFGLDPGLDLIMGVRAISEFDEVRECAMYGAGIPAPDARNNALNYKFSWSVEGVLKAYRRAAKIIREGRDVTIPPDEVFSPGNVHMLDVAELGGSLECFPNGNSVRYAGLFGIRKSVREMGRYTCRLPGHSAFWNVMVNCGFLDEEPVESGSARITPIQFAAALLGSQERFYYGRGEKDVTFVRVDVRGVRSGRTGRVIYQLIDTRDLETGFLAMQRTVGFTLSLGARLILQGKLRPGLLTPLDVPYDDVIPALARHGIRVTRIEAE